ncbi:MAG: phage tail protein [Deltaproteobacteria bacterium]|nr:phage tail protein [Deltaproteobacteria bacterium]
MGLAADATSFNPAPVQIKATGAGLPVGTVIAWPVATNPPDYASWMECDGRAVDQATYPELYALVGGNVPDFRGMFLRGVGGKAGELGELQAEGVYIDPATARISLAGKMADVAPEERGDSSAEGGMRVSVRSQRVYSIGSVTKTYSGRGSSLSNETLSSYTNGFTEDIPFSISVDGADETRPVNKSVRYLVRAKP